MYDIISFAHRYWLEAIHSYRQGHGFSHSFLHLCPFIGYGLLLPYPESLSP